MPYEPGVEMLQLSRFGDTKILGVAPIIQAAAYATGNLIGGKLVFPAFARSVGSTGLLNMILLQAKQTFNFAFDVLLFHTDPVNTTFTDKGAFALHANDFDKVITWFSLLAIDWSPAWGATGAPSMAKKNVSESYALASNSDTIYAALIARGAFTPAVGDLRLVLKALLD